MSHTVTIQPSGISFTAEENETILDAGLRADLGFPYSCRDGLCGTCKAQLLSGEVSYQGKVTAALDDTEKQQGLALLCQAMPRSDIRLQIHLLDDLPKRKILPCRVVKKEILSHDVVALWLKFPPTEHLDFHAGQYIDILLKDGRNRSFSIANAPGDDPMIELHIRHVEGGDFTGYIFYEMQEKEILRIEGPLGSFYLREDSERPVILMAGGTGFAPIKGIVEYMLAKGMTRPIHLYWGVRSQRDLYHHELAMNWAAQHDFVHYVPVLSEPEEHWPGRTGLVHEAILQDFDDLSGYDVYAGGSPAMVYAGKDAFHEKGLPLTQYFSDAFEFQAPKSIAKRD